MTRNDPTLATHTPSTVADDDPDRPRVAGPGSQFGRYAIVKLLGRGGVGAVYEADDPELERRVAIKVLRDDRAGDTEGLRREAQALARLVHQNVVMVYDVGVADGQVFLVMQLVESETIDAWLATRKAGGDVILAKFRQAGEGLVAAHDAGLVHCDFKPGNVLVDERGIVRVGDFGLARTTRTVSVATAASLTPMVVPSVGMTTIAGTPAYMAPEQFTGVVTAASDQFSFCVALWECLAGERPYADSAVAILDVTARGARRPLPRGAKVPKHVKRALERGLATDPSDRFPSMRALLAALEPPRSWLKVAALASATGMLAGGAVVYAMLGKPPEQPWDGADVANSQPLTTFGTTACAYSPAVDLGGTTVVFDRTVGDAVDLYSIPLSGGLPKQLTSDPSTWEWRAQRGRRAGEVVHLIHDETDTAKSQVAYLDLATGKETLAVPGLIWDAVVVGGTLYYSPDGTAGIRTRRGNEDVAFAQPPTGEQFFLIAASPIGDRIALTSLGANDGAARPCIVDVASGKLECLAQDTPARPAFGADGQALYYATYEGIVRRNLATGFETTVVKDVYAEGGLAVSPDGGALIYSTCFSHAKLVDVTSKETLIDSASVQAVAVGANGLIAWLRDIKGIRVLIARSPDGRDVQLTTFEHGTVSGPRFSPDGKRIVFGFGQPSPGLHVADLDRPGEVRQLTSDVRDKNPVWTPSGVIAYTRSDTDANEHVFAITSEGGAPKQLVSSTRTVYGNRGNELLVAGIKEMFWLDPATGVERRGPIRPPGQLDRAMTSPSGNWVGYQIGAMGQELWRISIDPPGPLERVVTLPAGDNVSTPTIRDDGHIIAVVGRYHGDLVRVPAKPGSKF